MTVCWEQPRPHISEMGAAILRAVMRWAGLTPPVSLGKLSVGKQGVAGPDDVRVSKDELRNAAGDDIAAAQIPTYLALALLVDEMLASPHRAHCTCSVGALPRTLAWGDGHGFHAGPPDAWRSRMARNPPHTDSADIPLDVKGRRIGGIDAIENYRPRVALLPNKPRVGNLRRRLGPVPPKPVHHRKPALERAD